MTKVHAFLLIIGFLSKVYLCIIFCQQACFLCFSYYIGNCWVCIDTVWMGLKFTRKLCFRVNFVPPPLTWNPGSATVNVSHRRSQGIGHFIITLLTKESRESRITKVHVTYYIGNDWVCIDTAWVGKNLYLCIICCQQACFLCFSYYIGNCWVCIDTVWVGLKFTRKLCFRVNFFLPNRNWNWLSYSAVPLPAKSKMAAFKRNGCHNKLHCCISSWWINKHLF
jgi:hypothetical protein